MSEERPKIEVNVVQVVASALAAVSSAVLLSTVGVAGTIIGAAVGSVMATVGAALYSYSLRISRERVQAAQAAALARMNRARTGPHPGTQTRSLYDDPRQDEPDRAEDPVQAADQERPLWREALSRLPWKWIAAIAGAVFVVAMIIILAFELLTGESLSDRTGGSDGGGHRTSFGFGSSSSAATQSPSPTPSGAASGSAAPTASGSASASSTTPSGPAADQPTLTPSTSSTPSTTPTTSAPSPSVGITKTPTATPSG